LDEEKWWNISSDNLNWSSHGNKHVPSPSKKVPWADVVKSTKNGPAKYLPGTNIEQLEKSVWDKGTPVTNGKTWKVQEFDDIIGASEGKSTKYMRVEMGADTIHGHPIPEKEFNKLTKSYK